MNQDHPSLEFWPEDRWVTSKGQVEAIHDAYWMTNDKGEIVFYKVGRDLSPQCNRALNVAEHVRDKIYPWATIKQIPLVLVPLS